MAIPVYLRLKDDGGLAIRDYRTYAFEKEIDRSSTLVYKALLGILMM